MVFQMISIAAFAAFYGCYFVKMLRQKRRGIQTDQLGKGKAGFVKFVEITMKAAAVLAFAAGLISIFTGTGRSPARSLICKYFRAAVLPLSGRQARQ